MHRTVMTPRTTFSRCLALAVLATAVGGRGSARAQIIDSNFDNGCPATNFWSCPDNWQPPQVPNNGTPVGTTYRVTLDGVDAFADNPFLDPFTAVVNILSLTMNELGSLRVTSTDLSVDESMIMNDRSVYRGLGPSPEAFLTVGDLTLNEGDPSGGPLMYLTSTMTATSAGAVLLDGTNYSGGPGSCTPPDLQVLGFSGFNVEGDFTIINAARINYTSAVNMCLAGHWNNFARFPDLVRLSSQKITLAPSCLPGPAPDPPPLAGDGTGGQHDYEVAGSDIGPVIAGFVDNYEVSQVHVANDEVVQFQDAFDNDDLGQKPCSEALYVNSLVLGSGSLIRLDECRVYVLQLINEGGKVQTIGCGELVQIPLDGIPAAAPFGVAALGAVLALAGGVLIRRRGAA